MTFFIIKFLQGGHKRSECVDRMKVSWALISVYLYLQYEQNQCDWSNSCSWFLLSEIGVGSKFSALLIKLISKINRRSKTTNAPSFSFHPY